MLSKNSITTIGSKFIILISNFLIVILTAKIWGIEGRGEIALILTDVAMIAIFNNIISGSSISYFASKIKKSNLFLISIIGSLFFSCLGAVFFSLLHGFDSFSYIFLLSVSISNSNSISSFFLGKKYIKFYNLLTLITPILILFYFIFFYYFLELTNLTTAYIAYIFAHFSSLFFGTLLLFKESPFTFPTFSKTELYQIIHYGFQNELSYFFQFLNYRIAYFIIAKYLGLSALGIFSVATSLAEAFWIVSKSLSAIHYANILNMKNKTEMLEETIKIKKQVFVLTAILMLFFLFIPNEVILFVFGKGFENVKITTILLYPGILAIAVSNIYGHYFAGVNKMGILRNKSVLGFFVTSLVVFPLLYFFELYGICFTINLSYIASSLYLAVKYFKSVKDFYKKN